ncbi:hypothetical protein QT20_00160, partial [Staphylococcus aureus]
GQRRRHDLRGLDGAAQRACNDRCNRDAGQSARRGMCLGDAVRVQGIVGQALKAALPIPVGGPVPQAQERARRKCHAVTATCW